MKFLVNLLLGAKILFDSRFGAKKSAFQEHVVWSMRSRFQHGGTLHPPTDRNGRLALSGKGLRKRLSVSQVPPKNHLHITSLSKPWATGGSDCRSEKDETMSTPGDEWNNKDEAYNKRRDGFHSKLFQFHRDNKWVWRLDLKTSSPSRVPRSFSRARRITRQKLYKSLPWPSPTLQYIKYYLSWVWGFGLI